MTTVNCFQSKLAKVYFNFKTIEEIAIDIYELTCEKTDEQFQSIYAEAFSLTKLGTEDK